MSPLLEVLGWAATGVFAGSYHCREPQTLRKVQAFAAVLWIGYGVVIQSFPNHYFEHTGCNACKLLGIQVCGVALGSIQSTP